MWRSGRHPGTRLWGRRWSGETSRPLPHIYIHDLGYQKLLSNDVHGFRRLSISTFSRWVKAPLLGPSTGRAATACNLVFCRRECHADAPEAPDPFDIHKQKLKLWFSHLPQEEKQFGGTFSPETMHVDPLIVERHPADHKPGPFNVKQDKGASVTVEELFQSSLEGRGQGVNVLLYGAVGTGKSTVVRKLVLDWCSGATLSNFHLMVPFSCEDLSKMSKAVSLRDLVGRKYIHLKKTPVLSGELDQARNVLFIFNGLEKMKLDFRMASTELCSDPNEALPPGAIVVNLLRKYLLPEASILVTTRLSALERVPQKYVTRYAQICGFEDPARQRAYFTSRLLQQTSADGEGRSRSVSKDELMELLYLNLRHESQLAAACYLPSYCWLTCATLHYLHYTDDKAPIRTLTGIYTSFLRLNFGGEVLSAGSAAGGVGSGPSSEQQKSLMLYVVQTVGKLAFDGVTKKRASFSEEDLEKGMGGGETKTDEELQKLAMFRTDVMDFFLVPCVESKRLYDSVESDDKHYVFAVPAMQEYLAALYVVLGENKTALEKLTKQVSATLGQAGEDVTTLFSILSKFIPFKIFAVFNLLKLFPSLVERISRNSKGHIARTMAAEMFRSEDCFNEDVLDQVEQSLLGVHGPHPEEHLDERAFELYPIFMGGLLHYGNRRLLEQLGCTIKSETVSQITKSLKKQLVRAGRNKLPPEETMDLLTLLYEFQNPRVTAEVMQSVRAVDLSTVRMTPLKCFVLSWVLNCCPQGFLLDELNLSSCSLNQELLHLLWPAFRHARNLTLPFNHLGPESCILLRDLLLEPNCTVKSLQLCDNDLLDEGVRALMDSLPENQSLEHLSLMHVGLGDAVALELAEQLANHTGLLELNVAYNNIGDSTAVALVNACREHPTIHTVHLYLNQLTEAGKQSLYELQQGGSGRRVRALASVMEGSDVSEDWRPILSIIAKNSISWERERVREQLQVFLRELEWGRLQQRSLWKRLHLRRVESGVKHTLLMLDKASAIGSPPKNNKPSLGKLWPTS